MSMLHAVLENPLKSTSWSDRIWHYKDNVFYERKIAEIADYVVRTLKDLPHVSPREAENFSELSSIGKFLKIAQEHCPSNESVKKCEKEFLAFKLAIPSETLDKQINPGFRKFAKNIHLDRQLMGHDHKLEVANNGEIRILYRREYRPWSEVREIACANPPAVRNPLPLLYNPPFKYGMDGVCNENRYNWTRLTPLKYDADPSWGNRYVLEICCLCSGKFRLTGDHSWIQLKEPVHGGYNTYAPGVYREDNELSTGFALKKAVIQDHDVSPFWPEKVHTLSFEIDQASFERIKAQIETDHNEHRVQFHILRNNCTTYAINLAKLAGIDIPMKVSFVYNFIPGPLQNVAQRLTGYLPRPISWLVKKAWFFVYYPLCVLFNIGAAFLGGMKISSTFSADEKTRLKPHLNSFTDLFKVSKVESESPYMLAFMLAPELAAIRKKEAAKSKVDVKTLRYWVPSQYRVKHV